MARNSRCIVAKGIKLDRGYKNTLSYSTNDMLSLLRNNAHLVRELTDCSFIRQNQTIKLDITYSQAIQSNYIAFENPDYDNKWFFAWIDDVKWLGEKCVEISYTIDAWSTWYGSWTQKPCLVTRHHVNVADDVVGAYTLPENLDTGEYIIDELIKCTDLENQKYIILSTEYATGASPTNKPLAKNFGGIYMPGTAYICDTITEVVTILQQFATEGYSDAVYGVYMVPSAVLNNTSSSYEYSGQSTPVGFSKYIDKPTSLNGYTPKNKKLLSSPYCFLNVSNNSGCINSYAYELFTDVDVHDNQCTFDINGVPVIGASIKCVPINYKNTEEKLIEDEGLICGKFPTLAWSEDAYINWLTQNSVNINIGVAGDIIQGIGSVLSLDAGGVANAITSQMNRDAMMRQHEMTPNIAKGNTNAGDINACMKTNTFYFSKMSIRQEYAKVIDDYFTRYGYLIRRLITPNLTGRPYWNYVEIGQGEEIGNGNTPSKFMETINNACRTGVTIWHSHDSIGNFSLDNR